LPESLGLITGGVMADTVGWRWSQYICSIIFAAVLVLFVFTFEETLFPRFLFPYNSAATTVSAADVQTADLQNQHDGKGKIGTEARRQQSYRDGFLDEFPKRTYLQMLKPWTRYPQNRTTFWQYFRRPFFLFSFPNIVIVSLSPFQVN
jgi:MFS family permease